MTKDQYRQYIEENIPDLPITDVNLNWLAQRMADAYAAGLYDGERKAK